MSVFKCYNYNVEKYIAVKRCALAYHFFPGGLRRSFPGFSMRTRGNPKRKNVGSVANYNTFGLIDTKTRKILLITSSARKCKKAFLKGYRIEVWNGNVLVNTIYNKSLSEIDKYIKLEKQHIAEKQRKAELRNKRRKNKKSKKEVKPLPFQNISR